MKKAGVSRGKTSESTILIVILVILALFIFGLKPMYRFFIKVKTGTLFETTDKKEEVSKPKEEEEVYKILKPIGESKLTCSYTDVEDGGELNIDVTLYHTNNLLKSIESREVYSGTTDNYANYILSEQNKYKQRKKDNLNNKGYSVEIDLVNTNTLNISEVLLLERTDIEDVSDEIKLKGTYNQDIYAIVNEYINLGYACEW